MGLSVRQGKQAGPSDLYIIIRDESGIYVDPSSLYFDVFQEEENGALVPMKSLIASPARIDVGRYYAPLKIPADQPLGPYLIRWAVQRSPSENAFSAEMRFTVAKYAPGC